ncbi:MAG: DUF3240 family protein [Gammaproteobacteria bacterium]|nr:DUF3240 family protein [Gammaproteobacteria bacterium]
MQAPSDLARLTLLYPPAIEARLVELLLEHEPELPGFTTLAAEGHGSAFAHASVRELVRGRVRRGMLLMVLPVERVGEVLGDLRRQLPNPEVVYWSEPVTAFGHLA